MIREFCCPTQHLTERILTHAQDEQTESIECPVCGKVAAKVMLSRTGAPILKAGCGGFYRASME